MGEFAPFNYRDLRILFDTQISTGFQNGGSFRLATCFERQNATEAYAWCKRIQMDQAHNLNKP